MLRPLLIVAASSLGLLTLAAGNSNGDEKRIAGEAPHEQATPIKVLLLGDRKAITPPLGKLGIDVTFTQNINDLNHATLSKYDCLAIYGDSGDLPAECEAAMLSFVEEGKGLAAIHCAR